MGVRRRCAKARLGSARCWRGDTKTQSLQPHRARHGLHTPPRENASSLTAVLHVEVIEAGLLQVGVVGKAPDLLRQLPRRTADRRLLASAQHRRQQLLHQLAAHGGVAIELGLGWVQFDLDALV